MSCSWKTVPDFRVSALHRLQFCMRLQIEEGLGGVQNTRNFYSMEIKVFLNLLGGEDLGKK